MSSTSSFGEHLKREREMRGVSLEEIAAATRISVRFLEALENEHWAQLPGGIFNRGFIRSIARFLGMDEEGLVAEYALETRERPEIAVWTREPVRKRRNWFAICATVVALALLGTGGWYVHRQYGPAIYAWRQNHPFLKIVMAKLHRKKATTAPDATAGVVSAAPLNTQAPKPPATQTPTPGHPTNPVASGQAPEIPSGARGAQAPNATAQGAMELKVEAGETSTVTVTADGKVVFSGKLEALKTLTLHAENSFTVSASKSNAILLELNGRTVPPLGPPNEPGKITLTHENLKPNPGAED